MMATPTPGEWGTLFAGHGIPPKPSPPNGDGGRLGRLGGDLAREVSPMSTHSSSSTCDSGGRLGRLFSMPPYDAHIYMRTHIHETRRQSLPSLPLSFASDCKAMSSQQTESPPEKTKSPPLSSVCDANETELLSWYNSTRQLLAPPTSPVPLLVVENRLPGGAVRHDVVESVAPEGWDVFLRHLDHVAASDHRTPGAAASIRRLEALRRRHQQSTSADTGA